MRRNSPAGTSSAPVLDWLVKSTVVPFGRLPRNSSRKLQAKHRCPRYMNRFRGEVWRPPIDFGEWGFLSHRTSVIVSRAVAVLTATKQAPLAELRTRKRVPGAGFSPPPQKCYNDRQA